MLANVFTILELQLPETYKQVSSNSQRWFGWKKHLLYLKQIVLTIHKYEKML